MVENIIFLIKNLIYLCVLVGAQFSIQPKKTTDKLWKNPDLLEFSNLQ